MVSAVMNSKSALRRSQRIQQKAACQGFDWPSAASVLRKINEELRETRDAVKSRQVARIHEEIGDLLFTVVGLAEKMGLDAEQVLREANRKFQRRFHGVEKELLRRGKKFPQELRVLDKLWRHVKR